MERGAAALLLLLRPGVQAAGDVAGSGSSGSGHAGGGGGGAPGTGRLKPPPTVFHTETEFISALIWRFVGLGLLAGALGLLLSNGEVWVSALFGILVGAGISLLTLVGLQDRYVLRFDVHRSKHGWLRTMMVKPEPFGFKLPMAALAVAALLVLTWVSGSPMYALGLVYLAALIGVGLALGHAIRRRRKK